MALGKRTEFQLEIVIRSAISAIHKFRETILESLWNISETSPLFVDFHQKKPLEYLTWSSFCSKYIRWVGTEADFNRSCVMFPYKDAAI